MEDEGTRLYKDAVGPPIPVSTVLQQVYHALREKGYNPVDQLVGYLLSGEPTYVTAHKGARASIGKVERHDVLEELVRFYVSKTL